MSTIEELREQIRDIDRNIIKNLALRQDVCRRLALLKKEAGKQIIDIVQEKKNFEFYESFSKEYSIDPKFIARLFRLVIINSKIIQQQKVYEIDLS
ncbi:chorismate mutase [Legionella fallonii]|uniref:chorismate mutase n=1 Tax=Legionella fallonii LLAP-10 TaxID=1212491 RepID=A0A098G7C9_9GAMM|nr:chorismate mutase [Legionella fallonii]CEG58368.1 Chorismate mutase [Legionella fallonii LLAP-10]